ncbi:MAG: alpha/beta hydrolase [Candidatus Paracaedibacteraceae bacterium]|nr:alpha/beta hydrolase [Candidatus Paracaedibacteraceae bacterium]
MKLTSKLKYIIPTLFLFYVITCFLVWGFQRHLIYAPSTNIQSPKTYGLQNFEDLRLKTPDGTIVQAWHRPAQSGFPTVIYFHGKTGHLGDYALFLKSLTHTGFGVLALSYRGYGSSQGTPSEAGIYQDARTIIKYAVQNLKLSKKKIIFYGRSLGTGVAIQMATEFSMAALILESPYTSIAERGQDLYPWLPVKFFIADRFDSLSKIKHIHSPMLIMHGEQDKIVPIEDGKILFKAAHDPKTNVYFPLKGHNNLNAVDLINALVNFTKKLKLIP